MTNEQIERLARKRAGAKLGFYIHAFVFSVVMTGLFVINFLTTSHPWSLGPFFGWSLGLSIHGVATFGRLSSFRQRLIEAEMKKLRSAS